MAVSKGRTGGTNSRDREFAVRDLIVFGVVLVRPISVVTGPFDVIKEPAKWFPPKWLKRDFGGALDSVLVV